MKILAISDLHYERRVFHGVDESRAWDWLMGVVENHSPDAVLSCDDWDTAVNEREFYELLRRTLVLTIYGNHENVGVLTRLYNIRTGSYLPVLIEDGKIYDVGGIKVAGINGIISEKRKIRKGVPRKTPEEFLKVARKLAGKEIDVILMHETPYLPDLFPFMRKTTAALTALEAVRIVMPKLLINGHIHSGGIGSSVSHGEPSTST